MSLLKTQNSKALLVSAAILFAAALFVFACGLVPAQTAHAAEATATTLTSGTRADGSTASTVHATAKSKSKSKRKMSKARVTGATPQFTTSLKRVKLPLLKVRWKGKTLRKGRDYTLKYKNNKMPGVAKVVIKGKGRYKGTKTVKFRLVNLGDDLARRACKLSYSMPSYFGQGYGGTEKYLASSFIFNTNYTRSCDSVIGVIVKSSGYDASFTCGLASQQPYLGFKSKTPKTDKWVCVGTYVDGDEDTGKLQPGDIVMRSEHVCMYVGNKIAQESYWSSIQGTDGDRGVPTGNWVSGHFASDSRYPRGQTPRGSAACIGGRSYAIPGMGAAKIYRCIKPDIQLVASSNDAYALPNSDKVVYSSDQLQTLSTYMLFIARNEIFARHGGGFANGALQAWFNMKKWYTQTLPAKSYNASILNNVEQANIKAIVDIETSRNSPYL